jgi:hypothetical protein
MSTTRDDVARSLAEWNSDSIEVTLNSNGVVRWDGIYMGHLTRLNKFWGCRGAEDESESHGIGCFGLVHHAWDGQPLRLCVTCALQPDDEMRQRLLQT